MPVRLNLKGASGEGEVTATDFMQQLGGAGYNPQELSPDGMSVTLVDDQGPYTMPIAEIAQQLGHQIIGITPENPNAENVSPALRFAVENLDDDDDRRMFLQAKINRRFGQQAPQIMGQGSDWFYFDPQTGQYNALTNAPGMDMSDVAGIAAPAAKIGSEILGYAAGGPLGGAAGNMAANATMRNIAGAKEGQGFGQFARQLDYSNMLTNPQFAGMAEEREALKDEMAANVDPDFASVSTAEEQGGQILKEGGLSAAFGTGMGLAGRALKPVGTGMEMTGAGAKRVGEFATGGPLRREALGYSLPGVGDAALAGTLARLPRGATTMAAEGVEKLGRSETAKRVMGENAAGRVAQFAEEIMAPRGTDVAEQVARGARNMSPSGEIGANARDVLGNLGEKAGSKLQSAAYERALARLAAGNDPGIMNFTTSAADMAARGLPRGGEIIGQGFENLARAGRGVERAAIGTGTAFGKGVQYGGAGMEALGRGMQGQGGFYGIYGLGRGMMPDVPLSEEQIIFDRWRKRRERDNIGLDFAQR